MRYHGIVLVPLCLFAGAVMAQSALNPTDTAEPHGNWTLQPAPPSSVEYRVGPPLTTTASTESPFRFRDSYPDSLTDHPAPRPTDREAVLGTDRPWAGGRPPLDCALTPHDPQC